MPTEPIPIDPDDLHQQGWHHDSECEEFGDYDDALESEVDRLTTRRDHLLLAVDQLHRAAHPHEPLRWQWCQQEPCRTLQEKT